MHRLGSRIHVLVGLWILAGLVVVGVNGAMLMSLLDEPLAGYSGGVRMADQGFRKYRLLVTVQAEKITSAMDLLMSRFKIGVVEEEKPVVQQPPATSVICKKKGTCAGGIADADGHYDQSIQRWCCQAAGRIGWTPLCRR